MVRKKGEGVEECKNVCVRYVYLHYEEHLVDQIFLER